jgi:hypothetical protein
MVTFPIYHGGQFYWWKKPENPEKTTDLTQVTDSYPWETTSDDPVSYGLSPIERLHLQKNYGFYHNTFST